MNFEEFPTTDIGKMIGDINNLDWMDFEKLKNDITFGMSIQNEKIFVVIKYVIKLGFNNYKEGSQCFICHIKREKNIWTSIEGGINFMRVEKKITPFQFNLIKNLSSNRVCKIEENHLPEEDNYLYKFIGTKEAWRRKRAVEKIERNWIICRYDPRYKMCEEVLIHNIEEIEIEKELYYKKF